MATQTMPGPDTGRVVPLSAPGFVGRQRERAALVEALARPPAVVLVEGEAGIGKSRLIHEIVNAPPDGLTILAAACPPVREGFTLGPIVDAVRRHTDQVRGLRLTGLAGALRPLFPEWTDDLPTAPEPAEDATAARHRLFRALIELLDALAVDALVVEDVHWADEATMEFLLFLATRVGLRPVSLVVTYRPEDMPVGSLLPRLASGLPAATTRLRLNVEPLDVVDTARLVSSMLAGELVTEEFARFLHERTEGVPLAVEELVRLMGVRADLVHRDGGWVRRYLADIVVPPTIRDAALERAGRLTSDALAVLRAAAVLDHAIDEATLLEVTALSERRARAGLTRSLETRLLVEDDRAGLLRYGHALARQAVYEAIPTPKRRALHRKAGQVLEERTPQPVARLAYHFREAGETDWWCQYGERAAGRALAVGDEATGAFLLSDLVLHASLPPRDMARLTNKIPLMVLKPSRCRELVRILRSVLRSRCAQPSEAADVRCQISRLLMALEDWSAARREMEQAVSDPGGDAVMAARTMTLLGVALGAECPASEHLRWLRRAAALRLPSASAEHLLVQVNRVSALLLLGEDEGWAQAALIPDDAPAARERMQIARGNSNVGEMAMLWGRYDEARQRLVTALNLAGGDQYQFLRDATLAIQAHLDWHIGAWDGLAGRVDSLAGEDMSPMTRLEAVLVAGLLHAATGSAARASESLQLVLAEMSERGAVNYLMGPAAALAMLSLANGRVEDSLQVTDEPISIVTKKGVWVWATDLAPARVVALLAADRLDDAIELVAAFGRGLRGRDAPAPKAALVLCRALLAEGRGERVRGASLFARAAAAWDALPRPYDALLARERQGRCLLADGRKDEALSVLGEVFEGLSRLGASVDADRVAHLLREQGRAVPRVWRGGRRGYGDQLSPRELEVVRLVVAGHTNRQIASTLSRSVRTIEVQLTSAMRKLGVSSRAALAVRAVETSVVSSPGQHASADSSSLAR